MSHNLTCTALNCTRPHKGRGYCDLHLQRLRRTGTIDNPTRTLEQRFWAKVDKSGPDECWLWTGARNDNGYGVMRPEGKRTGPTVKAHRVSAQLAGMNIDGLMVLHSCDNPPCVNPAHLRPGTAADNARDALERGRPNRRNATLAEQDVALIRALAAEGLRHRDIAAHFGVTRSNVTVIASGRTWQHVPPAAHDLIGTVVEAITGEEVAA